jgi:hypothetical protein
VARRVFLHVGTPKTGTTYLQTVMWQNRAVLIQQDVLFPGQRRVDHLYASVVIREEPNVARRDPRAPSAWDRLLQQIRGFDGTAVISHEFFGAASAEQAQAVLTALEPAELHVVVTARDCLAVLPALWQEQVKFRATKSLSDFGGDGDADPLRVWGWRTIDTVKVLQRWGSTLPPERVHVIPVPGNGAPPDLLWRRYAGLIGVDPDSCDTSAATTNSSLGVVEVELMRKVNSYLGPDIRDARDVSRWLRTYLAAEVLAPRRGERYGPGPEQESMLRKKALETVEAIRDAGYDVIGELDELLPAETGAELRHPDSVTSAELAEAGAATIARLLADLRRVTAQRDRLRAEIRRPASRQRLTPVGRLQRRLSSLEGRLRAALGRARATYRRR